MSDRGVIVYGKTTSTPEFVDKFSSDRKKVADFSASVLSGYLSRLPKNRAGDYGFRLPEHISKATLLSPIPIFFPDRVRSMERSVIEKSLETRPDLWVVPLVVDGYIPCLLKIDLNIQGQPEVETFGGSYQANRIEAGLRLLGWPGVLEWQKLSLLSFYEPTIDLLLMQKNNKEWEWLNLEGTVEARSKRLDIKDIDLLIKHINETRPGLPVSN